MSDKDRSELQAHEVRKGSNVINANPVETIKIQPQKTEDSKENK